MPEGAIEPLLLPEGSIGDLADLALELTRKTSSLIGQIPSAAQSEIERIVRSVDCYYSNLIEGHDTPLGDIESALRGDLTGTEEQRDLKLEARAHIAVQQQIDSGHDEPAWPTSQAYIRWLHREFCSRLPKRLLCVRSQDSDREIEVVPGEYRLDAVRIGRFQPPDHRDVPRFMVRFEEAYESSRLPKLELLISCAASHHRVLWIHPFLDGNGRIARLMSHALLLKIGAGSNLWSISRALARNVEQYKMLLSHADATRRNDYDGRGSLSLIALRDFTEFFLRTCLEEVNCMDSLLDSDGTLRRGDALYERIPGH